MSFHYKRAYTLLEILIVLGIIAALALLAVPSYNRFQAIQTFRQKAEETRSLVVEAYNLSQNPEAGVANYLIIPDHESKKFILAKQTEATPNTPDVIKEITLDLINDQITCTTGTNPPYCGILYCSTIANENPNDTCYRRDPGTDYYDLSDDLDASPFTMYIYDYSAEKYFFLSDGSGSDVTKFETQGLRSTEGDIP